MDAQTAKWGEAFSFTDEDKKGFAAALLREPSDSFKAAVATFGPSKDNVGKCLFAAQHLVNDREVIAHTHLLLKDGGVKNFLPSKDEIARRIWEWTDASSKVDMKDKVAAMKLLCEIQDFMPKQAGATVNVNLNRVMEVPVAASEADWERAVSEQQSQLVKDAVALH